MISIRRASYHATGVLHKLLLVVLPLVFAIATLLSTPKYIEQALRESRAYDQFVTAVIDNSQQQTTDPVAKELLAQPEIQAAAQKAFPPSLLQSLTENVINGVFAWAQGKTTEPEFRIDLTNAKNSLSTNIAAYAEKRANTLPACTLQQLRELPGEIDLLQIPCLPPGINVSAEAQKYGQNFLSGDNFLANPVVTNETIAQNNNGKSISNQLPDVPEAYSAIMLSKWVTLAVLLLLTALLLWLGKSRRASVRHIAWSLIGVGAFLVINLIIYWYISGKINDTRATADVTEAMWIDGITSLVRAFNQTIVWFGAGYIAFGAGALAALRWLKPPTETKVTLANTEQDAAPPAPITANSDK